MTGTFGLQLARGPFGHPTVSAILYQKCVDYSFKLISTDDKENQMLIRAHYLPLLLMSFSIFILKYLTVLFFFFFFNTCWLFLNWQLQFTTWLSYIPSNSHCL